MLHSSRQAQFTFCLAAMALNLYAANNLWKEVHNRKARGSSGRTLDNDEVREKCKSIREFCQLSKEDGGYASEGAKTSMIEKLRAIEDKLTNEEMLARCSDADASHMSQEKNIDMLKQAVMLMEDENNRALDINWSHTRALQEQGKKQDIDSARALVNIETMEAAEEAKEAEDSLNLKEKELNLRRGFAKQRIDDLVKHRKKGRGIDQQIEGNKSRK